MRLGALEPFVAQPDFDSLGRAVSQDHQEHGVLGRYGLGAQSEVGS